ncbi:hypothetical protein OC845_001351 [Tilletia horrida]|nr:hypothetical protein OC845_001351 [Tilletia horrida]
MNPSRNGGLATEAPAAEGAATAACSLASSSASLGPNSSTISSSASMNPSASHQRPLPPSALRKRSAALQQQQLQQQLSAPASNPSTAPATPSMLDDAFVQQDDISKDDLERALQGLSRDDLVTALGRAKKAMDTLDAQLEARTVELQELQAFTEDLVAKTNLGAADQQSIKQAVAQRDERNDHLLREQERLEEELYAQIQIVERLRRSLQEAERAQTEAERRYTDQTATADKERQAFADMEALLRSQKASESAANEKLAADNQALQRENERMVNHIAALEQNSGSANAASLSLAEDEAATGTDGLTPSARRARAKSAADAEAAALRSELAAATKTQRSYVEALQQLQTELSELKTENASLRDTNYSLIDILQEKSFSGALFAESAVLSRRFSGKGGREAAAASMLEETSEEDEDEDETESESGTPSIDQDDVDDVPDRPRSPSKPKSGRKKRRAGGQKKASRSRSNSNALLEVPTDLGSELAQSGLSESGKGGKDNKKRDRSGHEVSDNKDVLQKEVIELRETNAALSVYIAKVIDRVLARDGFERVLSTDPETKRAGIASQRSKARSARPSILPQNNDDGDSGRAEDAAGGAGATSRSSKRQSMGILGFGRSPLAAASDALNGVTSTSGPQQQQQPPAASSASSSHNHSRSRMSVDWRGLLSGIGGGPAKDPREANLRPLVLRSNTITPSSSSNGGGTQHQARLASQARKVADHEEVEDQHDEFERERIRADLQMQGYSPPEHQLRQRTISTTTPGGSGTGKGGASTLTAFLSRVVSGAGGASASNAGMNTNEMMASPSSMVSPGGVGGPSPVGGRDLLAEARGHIGSEGGDGAPGKVRFPSSSTDSQAGTRTSSMAGDESYLIRGP